MAFTAEYAFLLLLSKFELIKINLIMIKMMRLPTVFTDMFADRLLISMICTQTPSFVFSFVILNYAGKPISSKTAISTNAVPSVQTKCHLTA